MNELYVNKALVIGLVSNPPEMRSLPSGTALLNVKVVTEERFVGRDGQMNERKTWHNVVVWGNQAQQLSQTLQEGQRVYVEGRIQTRSYEDQSGNKRYFTEINARTVHVLPSAAAPQTGPPAQPTPAQTWQPNRPQQQTPPAQPVQPAATQTYSPGQPTSGTGTGSSFTPDDDLPF